MLSHPLIRPHAHPTAGEQCWESSGHAPPSHQFYPAAVSCALCGTVHTHSQPPLQAGAVLPLYMWRRSSLPLGKHTRARLSQYSQRPGRHCSDNHSGWGAGRCVGLRAAAMVESPWNHPHIDEMGHSLGGSGVSKPADVDPSPTRATTTPPSPPRRNPNWWASQVGLAPAGTARMTAGILLWTRRAWR